MPSCSRIVVCSIRLSTCRSCSLSVAFLARAVSSSPSSRLAIVSLSLPSPLLVGAPGQLPATVLDSRCPNNTKKSTEIIILAYLTNAALLEHSPLPGLTPSRQERAQRVRLPPLQPVASGAKLWCDRDPM